MVASYRGSHGLLRATKETDLIVEKYQSGQGYKKILKALDVLWSTVKTIISKGENVVPQRHCKEDQEYPLKVMGGQ